MEPLDRTEQRQPESRYIDASVKGFTYRKKRLRELNYRLGVGTVKRIVERPRVGHL